MLNANGFGSFEITLNWVFRQIAMRKTQLCEIDVRTFELVIRFQQLSNNCIEICLTKNALQALEREREKKSIKLVFSFLFLSVVSESHKIGC